LKCRAAYLADEPDGRLRRDQLIGMASGKEGAILGACLCGSMPSSPSCRLSLVRQPPLSASALAARFGTDLAVAAIVLPHLSGGLLRGWRLRHSLDGRVLVRFGILSAIGGLIGALVFAYLEPTALGRVLGALLVLTATAGVTGWSERWRPIGPLVWVLGALSGFFGGVVGNQGGLRAASLSAFGLKPTVFVATSTVIG
jgi:uncharacterized membrane protein YfcA